MDSYCRLCAERKHFNIQLDLTSNETELLDISVKLCRINAPTDFNVENLPKTVCYDCLNLLNKAVDFVNGIENAQASLQAIFALNCIKVESEEYYDPPLDDLNLKLEPNHLNSDVDSEEDKLKLILLSDVDKAELSESECLLSVLKRRSRKNNQEDSKHLSELPSVSWATYEWLCTFCETRFPNIEDLQAHSLQLHKACNPYRCTSCKIRKQNLDKFIIHVQKHNNELKKSCYKCHKRYNTPAAVRKHRLTHLKTNFVCDGCNSSFTSNDELIEHKATFVKTRCKRIDLNSIPVEGLKCLMCKKVFSSRSVLRNHLAVHTERQKDQICDICGKSFFSKHNLAIHLVMHKDERPYKCKICTASFKVERLLKNHVGVHDNIKPFSCDECGRCFRLRKQLESHRIIHTNMLPFACTQCDKRFRFKSILNNHVRIHTGVKPYSCQLCQRDFTNWSNYNKHMKRRHGTDTSRKKYTPAGMYPLDPKTGDIILPCESKQLQEWKMKMTMPRRPGRPPNIKSKDYANT